MQHKLIGILSLLFASFLFAVPASAVTLPTCGPNADGSNDFVLVGQDQIIFESSDIPKTIVGNVLLTGPNGLVKLGKNITITGTVTANKIEFHSSGTSNVGTCVANAISYTGPANKAPTGTCTPKLPPPPPTGDFDVFEAAHATCVNPAAFSTLCSQGGPAPAVDPCVNGKPALTVGVVFPTPAQAAAGLTNPLTPGCYGALVLENGAVLPLGSGAFAFSSVRMKAGSRLIGPATVNVNGQFITEPGVFITDLNLNIASSQGDVLQIFNNSVLSGVVINAPFGRCHPHTGTTLTACTEICCKTLDIEPINAEPCDFAELCVCKFGFKFADPADQDPSNRLCVPCVEGDTVSNCVAVP